MSRPARRPRLAPEDDARHIRGPKPIDGVVAFVRDEGRVPLPAHQRAPGYNGPEPVRVVGSLAAEASERRQQALARVEREDPVFLLVERVSELEGQVDELAARVHALERPRGRRR
jgi:hypothetical protein